MTEFAGILLLLPTDSFAGKEKTFFLYLKLFLLFAYSPSILYMNISVTIITFNEEKNIGRCIDSVLAVADEIVVLDSLSTDRTIEIARSKGALVYSQPFLGYVEQKNKALEFASHPIVLCLDADEALDETLQASVLSLKKSGKFQACTMNRCTWYCEKFIRHGNWYPDKKLRLFDKRTGGWAGDNPHDCVVLKPNQSTSHLKGDILHYSYHSIEEHLIQNNKFSTISAEALFKRGKKASFIKIVFSPLFSFLRGYIFRMGFLDGFYGFVVAINAAHLTFLKYAKLYRKQQEHVAAQH